ncbi:CsbD family protein [TM7 phylum sp. oral taxon 348]|nr:CsbD family protein [TM7 phylum sp. oral taxon 348]
MTDKGFTDKVKGKAKEVVGEATNDDSKKAEGILDQVVGKTKEVASNVKDVATELVEKSKDAIDSKLEDKEK